MASLHRLSLLFTTLALTTVTFAGCIGDGPENVPVNVLPELKAIVELTHGVDSGHTDASLHALSSDNLQLVAFHSLAGDGVSFVDGNAEVTYHDGYAYVATLGDTSGFVIVDVTEPLLPEVVGRYSNPNVYSPDVKVTSDGKYAILSSHPGTTLASVLPPQTNVLPTRLPDPTAYAEENHATGVTLVDVTDKTDPQFAAFYLAEPDGTHNTEYAKIDGRDLIFAVDRNKVQVLEITDTPTGVELVPIATITADDKWRDDLPGAVGTANPGAYLPPGSHDVVYQKHPVTGDELVYIAFGSAGSYIYNVNDPTAPSMVSNWRGLPADSSYYHYTMPLDIMIDERHITLVAPEIYNSGESTGTIAVLDTTNPREPQELGVWMLPGDDLFIEEHYRFSPHNMDVVDGKVFLANYHAGVWVLDFTCSGCLESPESEGFYMPHEETDRKVDGEVVCSFWCQRPFVWGVVAGPDNLLFASDVESGLYILKYTPDLWS